MRVSCNIFKTYRYGFNGKEKENELHGNTGDAYDFEARIYDARLGRWLTVDAQSAKYPQLSNYSAMGSNPLYYIDPSGNVLVVTGDVLTASLDVISTLPAEYQDKVSMGIGDVMLFALTEEDAEKSGDLGVMNLFNLVNSEKVYQWNVAESVAVVDNSTGETITLKTVSDDTKEFGVSIVGASKEPTKYGYVKDKNGSTATAVPIGYSTTNPSIDNMRTMNPS